MEIYGAAVADKLDNGRNILRRRYYRQHCTPDFGSYTKDLTAICNDLNRVNVIYFHRPIYLSEFTISITKYEHNVHCCFLFVCKTAQICLVHFVLIENDEFQLNFFLPDIYYRQFTRRISMFSK